MSKTVLVSSALAATAVVAGAFAFSALRVPTDSCAATTVAGGAIGGPFTLVDETGRTVTETEVITEPTILYFGYTFCPDVCPIDNARNAAAVDILAESGHSVTPVFISIDPARDSVEVVNDFTENFHPKMIGLTGTPEQVKEAANAYRVVYSKDDDDPEYYLVSHSVFSYFVTPEDGFVEFFRREDTPEQMADRIACHLNS